MTGVPTATLARWADRGLLTCIRVRAEDDGGGSGPRRYRRHEIDLIIVASIICQIDRPNSQFVEFVYRECRYDARAGGNDPKP
ncbi:hypothetical protein DPM19_28350 [Actinomadura craniellae]|uniref:Uncharacterized protein n=2 Tax=Actinomadura craniellae TaxID=2231787 RepID=A0A365GYI8_9ACTN|nr:hypothetical protein DPM19_28350 [Actinomadura craniellae]